MLRSESRSAVLHATLDFACFLGICKITLLPVIKIFSMPSVNVSYLVYPFMCNIYWEPYRQLNRDKNLLSLLFFIGVGIEYQLSAQCLISVLLVGI